MQGLEGEGQVKEAVFLKLHYHTELIVGQTVVRYKLSATLVYESVLYRGVGQGISVAREQYRRPE